MSDTTATAQASGLNIPDEVRQQFPDLIAGIEKSPSMNSEERQYWVDVLPIMTDDQIENLRSILDNESKEISQANQQYNKGAEAAETKSKLNFDEAAYLAKKQAREAAEKEHEDEELNHEAALLQEIESLDL